MTSTEQDIQSRLLTPQELLDQIRLQATTRPHGSYGTFVNDEEEGRTSVHWDWEANRETAYTGGIRLVIVARNDAITQGDGPLWARPNRIIMVHFWRGYATRIVFRVDELYPVHCKRVPSSTLRSLLDRLQIEDAIIED